MNTFMRVTSAAAFTMSVFMLAVAAYTLLFSDRSASAYGASGTAFLALSWAIDIDRRIRLTVAAVRAAVAAADAEHQRRGRPT